MGDGQGIFGVGGGGGGPDSKRGGGTQSQAAKNEQSAAFARAAAFAKTTRGREAAKRRAEKAVKANMEASTGVTRSNVSVGASAAQARAIKSAGKMARDKSSKAQVAAHSGQNVRMPGAGKSRDKRHKNSGRKG